MNVYIGHRLTTVKNHVIKNCEKVYERNGKIYFGIRFLMNKIFIFPASTVSTYDFSTLYTTLSHNLIKEKLT